MKGAKSKIGFVASSVEPVLKYAQEEDMGIIAFLKGLHVWSLLHSWRIVPSVKKFWKSRTNVLAFSNGAPWSISMGLSLLHTVVP